MTDEQPSSPESRRVRLASRRHRLRVLGGAFAIVVIAGGIGTAAALRDNNRSTPARAARTPEKIGDPPAQLGLGKASKLKPPRSISHADPMRLWVGGDSLAGSFGPALGQIAGATGVVDTTIDYKVSSGLADNGIRDWYQHAEEMMASENPDAVVFIIGTNDASIVNTQDSNNDGVPDWQVRYDEKIDEMMQTFVGGSRHRTVFWLGPPTLRDSTLSKGAQELDVVMRREAAKFAPDVVFVDTYRLFSDKSGDYSESLPDSTGEVVQMRISDGVHFSVDGAQYLGSAIWKLIDKRWDVARQADPSQPISYTIAQGSGDYVPGVGYYRPTVSQSTTTESGTTTVTTSVSSTTSKTGSTTSVKPPGSTVPPTTTAKPPPTTVPHTTTTTKK